MSRHNVDVVRRAFASDAPLTDTEQLARDAEFDFTALYPDQPVLHGVEEMRTFRDAGPWGESIRFVADRFFDVDDERVLVFVRWTASGERSGATVEIKMAHEFTFRDGLIVRVKVHPDRADALRAVGLAQ